ncbi:MAG: hypothetical protein IJT72_10280 [Lachnospiraceae bacterium]|nr:hypothetical protein [Lachnospiraceae bacterium]
MIKNDNERKKKSREQECFEKVLRCRSVKGKFASDICKIFIENKDCIDYSGERPDIIINTDNEIIGIEHCRVDMLFKTKKKIAQSMIGIQQSKSERLVEKYKEKELLEEDINNGNALKPVLDMVEERFEYHNKFDYSAFISNFNRVSRDHNKNCKDYRERMKKISSEKEHSLVCLIEIPYLKKTVYQIEDSKGSRVQAIKGIPITWDMLCTIQNMKDFDIVIICLYCFDNPSDDKDIVCYYFLPRAVKEAIKQQRIKPVISFDLTGKMNVKFLDKYEFGEGEIKFYAKASFDNKKH